MTPMDAGVHSTKSLNIRLTLLGSLLLLACGSFWGALFSLSILGSVTAIVAYVLVMIALWKSCPYFMPLVSAAMFGGARSGLIVGGLGGLVAFEIARLAGSSVEFSIWSDAFLVLGALVLGMYMVMGLSALMVAGVNRGWLLGILMLLVPGVSLVISPWLRSLMTVGVAPLNYAMLALICFGFGVVAFPTMRATYRREVQVEKESEERARVRAQEKNETDSKDSEKTDDSENPATEAAHLAARAQVDSDLKGVGVALSGGGHRATLFDLGVLLYLARAGKNHDVSHITSVSGGSLTSGYIARSLNYRTCTSKEFDKVAGSLAGQIADRGTLFALWRSWLYIAALILTAIMALAGLVLWISRPVWIPATWLVPAAVFAMFWLAGYVLQQRGKLCEWAFREVLFSRDGKPIGFREVAGPPLHVICATEVQTGNGAYFTKLPFNASSDAGVEIEYLPAIVCEGFQTTFTDFQLATAVQASAAFPLAFPTVKLEVKGWGGIARRKVSATWTKYPSSHMLLTDGGVRDNLGVEWFDRARHLLTDLIVVNGAANRVRAKQRRVGLPLLGEIISLMLIKDVPYNTREQNRRRELLMRFVPSYEGAPGIDTSGAILHIEESPYDLAETVDRATSLEKRDYWFLTNEDIIAAQALEKNPLVADFKARAKAVRAKLEAVENIDARRAANKKSARNETWVRFWDRYPADLLVAEQWQDQAYRNSLLPTNLSKFGRPAAAELIRHSFALAMAKLHILLNYPLCDVPSIEEITKLMEER